MNYGDNNSSGCGCIIALVVLCILFPALFWVGLIFIILIAIRVLLALVGIGGPNSKANTMLFLEAVFSSLGKLAKSDGVVCQSEASRINRFIRELGLSQEQKELVAKSFKEGTSSSESYQFFINRVVEVSGRDRSLLQMVLGLYCDVAMSDGKVSQAETEFINYAEQAFGLRGYSHYFFNRGRAGSYSSSRSEEEMETYYSVLGIQSTASDSELKKAYRKKCVEFHPDKIASKGLPEEFKKFAEEEMKKVNQAYDFIKKKRGL